MLNGINFRQVRWGATLWVHLLRAAAAGLVWALIVMLVSGWHPILVGFPAFWAASYVVTLPLAIVVGKILTMLVGDVGFGLAMLLFTIGLLPGDPLVHWLHRTRPSMVPVERFGVMNFMLIMFVLDEAKGS